MKIIVIGAGAWGTALAMSAMQNPLNAHDVVLWARDPAQADAMQTQRVNSRYLPGLTLPDGLNVLSSSVSDLSEQIHLHDLVVIATPMSGLRDMLERCKGYPHALAWLCKGLEPSSSGTFGLMAHEIQAHCAPNLRAGVLSGPSFAQEVAQRKPTALVAASAHADVRDALVTAFHSPSLRIYGNEDIVGVEVGGAVKNVLAIAAGLCDGMQLGLNARAALITRGLAEMTRLGLALGARIETFMGLSGLGDLVLTATGDLSRNRKVGMLLAQGKSLQDAVTSLGHVAEGVHCARTVLHRAQGLQVPMPITQAVVNLLDGNMRPAQALEALMGREPASERPQG